MKTFKEITKLAQARKDGPKQLQKLLPKIVSKEEFLATPDDRFLAMMTKCLNQAGFSWKVIEQKWPEIEEAFMGFDIDKLSQLSDEQWENYTKDRRVVRSWQKIKATRDNVLFVKQIRDEYGSMAKFLDQWPHDDQVGLMNYLKKNGSRLGGHTGQRFLRLVGWDAFILMPDVITSIIDNAGVKINMNPTSQKDLSLVQEIMNKWHSESGLPYSHISKILAYSAGTNYDVEFIKEELEKIGDL